MNPCTITFRKHFAAERDFKSSAGSVVPYQRRSSCSNNKKRARGFFAGGPPPWRAVARRNLSWSWTGDHDAARQMPREGAPRDSRGARCGSQARSRPARKSTQVLSGRAIPLQLHQNRAGDVVCGRRYVCVVLSQDGNCCGSGRRARHLYRQVRRGNEQLLRAGQHGSRYQFGSRRQRAAAQWDGHRAVDQPRRQSALLPQ